MATENEWLDLLGTSDEDKQTFFETWRTKYVNDNLRILETYIKTYYNTLNENIENFTTSLEDSITTLSDDINEKITEAKTYQGEISTIVGIISDNAWKTGWYWYVSDGGSDGGVVKWYERDILLAIADAPEAALTLPFSSEAIFNKYFVIIGGLKGYKVGGTSANGEVWNANHGYIPVVKSDGGIELGKYIDLHLTSDDGIDRDIRIGAYKDENGNPVLKIEGASDGTMANIEGNKIVGQEGTFDVLSATTIKVNGTSVDFKDLYETITALKAQLNGISFGTDENGNLTYEKEELTDESSS